MADFLYLTPDCALPTAIRAVYISRRPAKQSLPRLCQRAARRHAQVKRIRGEGQLADGSTIVAT
ncbi:hypothetical protein [Leptothoe kymatousa]|uniref:Uncharacterized protein n=1 Tax=Leptothoe kymatousa TAU-MAC 1615 TaxID=2364775 RepID=A0ABS5Y591_9CYAN|nr:hypothetical protein [Leptothoe kymatousa]MBT9312658.1 hypothetical protein [Leptothoe kymatousa TAU-MAC 1615]